MTVLAQGAVLGFDVVSYGDPALGDYPIPGAPGVHMSMRRDVSPLLVSFTRDFNATVERLRQSDSGCHNPRMIAGTSSWSRHAAAIAMDFNWQLHVQGRVNTFTPSQRVTITALLDRYRYQGVRLMRWGGTYPSPDEMHFEVNVPRSVALSAVAELAEDWKTPMAVLEENLKPYNGVDIKLGTAIAQILARTDYLANKAGLVAKLDAILVAANDDAQTTVTMSEEDRAKLAEQLATTILDAAAARMEA